MFNTVNLVIEFRVWPSKSSHIDTMNKINSVCAVYFITLGQTSASEHFSSQNAKSFVENKKFCVVKGIKALYQTNVH